MTVINRVKLQDLGAGCPHHPLLVQKSLRKGLKVLDRGAGCPRHLGLREIHKTLNEPPVGRGANVLGTGCPGQHHLKGIHCIIIVCRLEGMRANGPCPLFEDHASTSHKKTM